MRKKFLTTRLINDVDIINPKAHIFFGGRVLSFFIEPYFRSKGRYRSFENKNALSSMFENQQSILCFPWFRVNLYSCDIVLYIIAALPLATVY